MDTLTNLQAFLAVADAGGFAAAGRRLGVATSVVAKRVDQLEAAVSTRLFDRTTRSVRPTEAGRGWMARVRPLLADADEILRSAGRPDPDLEGPLRVKAPTTLTLMHLADLFAAFQRAHPRVALDIVLTDRPVNPLEEGFDLAFSAFGTSYGGVTDIPLCPFRRLTCAAPDYLARRGTPRHPRDLGDHAFVGFQPTGHVLSFEGRQGPVEVTVRPSLSANDGQVLLAAATAGNGIAILSDYVVAPALRRGALVEILPDFPVPQLWLKLLVPAGRMAVGRVRALVALLQAHFSPDPPWGGLALGTGSRPIPGP